VFVILVVISNVRYSGMITQLYTAWTMAQSYDTVPVNLWTSPSRSLDCDTVHFYDNSPVLWHTTMTQFSPSRPCALQFVYVIINLSYVSSSNCSLSRLNVWLLFICWLFHGKSADCTNYQVYRLIKYGKFSQICLRQLKMKNTRSPSLVMKRELLRPEPEMCSRKQRAPELALELQYVHEKESSKDCAIAILFFTTALQPRCKD